MALALAAGLVAPAVAVPVWNAAVSAQAVAQSYIADEGTMAAMIVQIDAKDGQRVQPASKDNLEAIHGVVVMPNDAPLSLSEATVERQVYVTTSGTYRVLVSDENGPIRKDDYVAVSSIDGVGMQANPIPNIIVGKALSDFDGQTGVQSQTKVKDDQGNDRTVRFGYVTANINVTRNPLLQPKKDSLPGLLRIAAEVVAGKPVSAMRVYISFTVLLLTVILAGVIIYTGIRTSMTAIGRNPLAKKSILRNLLQVVLIGLIILIVGLFAVYLLLKL